MREQVSIELLSLQDGSWGMKDPSRFSAVFGLSQSWNCVFPSGTTVSRSVSLQWVASCLPLCSPRASLWLCRGSLNLKEYQMSFHALKIQWCTQNRLSLRFDSSQKLCIDLRNRQPLGNCPERRITLQRGYRACWLSLNRVHLGSSCWLNLRLLKAPYDCVGVLTVSCCQFGQKSFS